MWRRVCVWARASLGSRTITGHGLYVQIRAYDKATVVVGLNKTISARDQKSRQTIHRCSGTVLHHGMVLRAPCRRYAMEVARGHAAWPSTATNIYLVLSRIIRNKAAVLCRVINVGLTMVPAIQFYIRSHTRNGSTMHNNYYTKRGNLMRARVLYAVRTLTRACLVISQWPVQHH